jgi:hypothetical protein
MIQYLRNCLKGKAHKDCVSGEQRKSVATNKKVIVTRFDRDPVPGFVQTPGGFSADSVELLTPSGTLVHVPYSEVKAVCFVRDFEDGDGWHANRAYAARPKTAGLWVRLTFRDGDTSEGVIPNNLMLLEPEGFQVIPPDPSFLGQRLFVPREALRELLVLGVIGSPLKRKRPAKAEPESTDQLGLF